MGQKIKYYKIFQVKGLGSSEAYMTLKVFVEPLPCFHPEIIIIGSPSLAKPFSIAHLTP